MGGGVCVLSIKIAVSFQNNTAGNNGGKQALNVLNAGWLYQVDTSLALWPTFGSSRILPSDGAGNFTS